jgi:hypothetical protein
MDTKKVIETLVKLAQTQQKIIHKMAQAVQLPGSGDVSLTPDQAPTHPDTSNPAANLTPNKPKMREAQLVLDALPAQVRPTIYALDVANNQVRVKFHPGKGSDAAFSAITQAVNRVLPPGSYKVVEVA